MGSFISNDDIDGDYLVIRDAGGKVDAILYDRSEEESYSTILTRADMETLHSWTGAWLADHPEPKPKPQTRAEYGFDEHVGWRWVGITAEGRCTDDGGGHGPWDSFEEAEADFRAQLPRIINIKSGVFESGSFTVTADSDGVARNGGVSNGE